MTEQNHEGKSGVTSQSEQFIPDIALKTNPLLDRICQIIPKATIPWTEVIPDLLASYPIDSSSGLLHGALAEGYLTEILRRITQLPPLKDRCQIDIPDGKVTPNYSFKKFRRGGLYAISNETQKQVAEYDALMCIDNLPVLFEAKAMRSNKSKGGLQGFLRPNHLASRFRPLQELYQTNEFGLVVVTIDECIDSSSNSQQTLLHHGGKLIPFPFSGQELRKKIPAPPSQTIYSSHTRI